MGRGAGTDSDRLLARLRWGDGPEGGRAEGQDGWVEDPAASDGGSPGSVAETSGATRWRLGGVPPGLAVVLLVVALVAFVLLGRLQSGSGELLVGPGAGPAVSTVEPTRPVVVNGAPAGRSQAPAGPSEASAAPVVGPLLVHVDGAVNRPGVVTLRPGARVADAVQAAGGVSDDADTRLVNLARVLVDGEQVVVPRPGEEALGAPVGAVDAGTAWQSGTSAGAGAGAGAGANAAGGAGGAAGLVDLNTADAAGLDALPGIGPVLAERIVGWREESGPFTTIEDLTEVSGIGPAVMADVRDLVTV